MGRPAGTKNKPKEDTSTVATLEVPVEKAQSFGTLPQTPKISEAQAVSNKAFVDASDSEKSKKDVMLKTVKELESHIKYLRDRIGEMDFDFSNKRRILDGINGSIAGAQAELASVNSILTAKNEKFITDLNKRASDVDRSDKTLRELIAQNQALLISNKQKESSLIEESFNCKTRLADMQNALNQNNVEWKKREADILEREEALKKERSLFELEKEALAPEAMRITAIKNENVLLLQEIEREKANNRNMYLGIEAKRQEIEDKRLVDKAAVDRQMEIVANNEARLRSWEENLKDFDLEIRARAAKADKLLRQLQLEKEANS